MEVMLELVEAVLVSTESYPSTLSLVVERQCWTSIGIPNHAGVAKYSGKSLGSIGA
jgi:hypothetical protein